MKNKINRDSLIKNFSYDQDTGVFKRIKSRRKDYLGMEQKRTDKHGYRIVVFNRYPYFAHRLAWLYVYGEYPSCEIDHINGIRTDNRIANLRLADRSVNTQNIGNKPRSGCGYLGVTYKKSRNKFSSVIQADGKKFYLGEFDDAQTAHKAYLAAKTKLHKGFSRHSEFKNDR